MTGFYMRATLALNELKSKDYEMDGVSLGIYQLFLTAEVCTCGWCYVIWE